MKINIAIPTIKTEKEILPLLETIRNTLITDERTVNIVHTCLQASAARNRNYALSKIQDHELVIMLDDDITGFTAGWERRLIQPFCIDSDVPLFCPEFKRIAMVSARLLKADGRTAHMMGENYDMSADIVVVDKRRLPTACIAFIKQPAMKFDEQFVGSGFEDDDFCRQVQNLCPKGQFVINNTVKLIHANEMKNQKGPFWEYNKRHYLRKWPDEENRWH